MQGAASYPSLAAAVLDASLFFAWMQVVLHATERYFLAEQFNDTAERLSWLIHMTAVAPPINGWSSDNTAELTPLYQHCLTLMARLSSGLDFYGFPKNRISTISFQDDLNSMVTMGSLVEAAYKAYFLEAHTEAVQRAQIAAQISSDQTTISTWQAGITSNAGKGKRPRTT